MDYFAFEAKAKDVLSLSGDSEPDFALRLPDGALLGSREMLWQAPAAGTYFFEVTGTKPQAKGIYEFGLELLVDDAPNVPSPDVRTVTFGSTISGRLEAGTDVDLFAFDVVEAGTTLSLGTDSSLSIAILYEDGARLFGSKQGFSRGTATWKIVEPGRYFLQVMEQRPFERRSDRDYELQFDGRPDDYPDSQASDELPQLDFDGSRSGRWETVGDRDVFRLTAIEGQDFEVRISDTSGAVSIVDDSGLILSNHREVASTQATYTGNYFVVATAGRRGSGYSITARVNEDDHGNSNELATPTTLGDLLEGSIGSAGDEDWFTFDVTAGNVVRIVASGVNPFGLQAKIVTPDGVVLSNGFDFQHIASSGQHTLIVTAILPGDYNLTIESIADDWPDSFDDGPILLEDGKVYRGVNERRRDDDLFAVDLPENGDLQFEFLDRSEQVSVGLLSADFQRPDRTTLSENRFSWQVTEAGRYYVIIQSSFAVGEYAFQIDAADDKADIVGADATAVEMGNLIAGTIEIGSDIDIWPIQAQAGKPFDLSVNAVTPFFPTLRLLAVDGVTELASAQRETLSWNPKQTEILYLSVASNSVLDGRPYEISFGETLQPDDFGNTADELAHPAEFDTSYFGRINTLNDSDVWKIDLKADESVQVLRQQYTVGQAPRSPFPQTIYRLYDSGGNVLIETERVWEDIGFRASGDETVYFEVTSTESVGTYEVTFQKYADDKPDVISSDVPSIDSGEFSGISELMGDRDLFRFEAEVNEIFTFNGVVDTSLNILNESGEILASSTRQQSSLDWQAVEAGTYFAAVSHSYLLRPVEYSYTFASQFDDVPNTFEGAKSIQLNETLNGRNEIRTDADMYVFEAEAGKDYEVQLDSGSVAVFNSSRARLPSRQWFSEAGGKYYLRVINASSGYVVSIVEPDEDSPDDHPDVPTPNVAVLKPGEPVAGRRDSTEDLDVFSFSAQSGDVVEIVADLDFGIRWRRVLTSGGDVVDECEGDCSSGLVRIPEDGNYFLEVQFGGFLTPFQLALGKVEVDDDAPDRFDAPNLPTLELGQNSIRQDTVNDVDVFAFQATENTVYDFRGSFRERPQISSPSGAITSMSDPTFATSPTMGGGYSWKASETGLHRIALSGSSFTEMFTVTADTFDEVTDRPEASAPVIGPNASQLSRIDIQGDFDVFQFEAEAGATYEFQTVLQATESKSLRFSLYDQTGREISRSNGGKFTWNALVSGSHYIGVTGESVLDYSLSMVELQDAVVNLPTSESPELKSGSTVTSTLDYSGDKDVFRFEATEGESYQFSVSRDSLAANTTLSVLDQDGVVLREDLGERLAWTATSSGSFFLAVAGTIPVGYELGMSTTQLAQSNSVDGDGTGHSILDQVLFVDLDGDSAVSFEDFLIFASVFGSTNEAADFDSNGLVDFGDFLLFADSYGENYSGQIQTSYPPTEPIIPGVIAKADDPNCLPNEDEREFAAQKTSATCVFDSGTQLQGTLRLGDADVFGLDARIFGWQELRINPPSVSARFTDPFVQTYRLADRYVWQQQSRFIYPSLRNSTEVNYTATFGPAVFDDDSTAVLQVEQPFTGDIFPPGDSDLMQIDLQPNLFYHLDLQRLYSGSHFDPEIWLLDSSQKVVRSGFFSDLQNSFFKATGDGRMFIEIKDNDNIGAFTIQLSPESDSDNTTATAWPLDGPVSLRQSKIDMPGDVDWHRLDGEAGQVALIRARSLQAVDVTLYAEDGTTQLATRSVNGDLVWEFAESGPVYVTVSMEGTATGDYSLATRFEARQVINVPPEPIDATLALGAPNSLAPNSVRGSLTEDKLIESFQFRAVDGEHSYVVEVKLDSLNDSRLRLFNELGELVSEDDDGGQGLGSKIVWQASESGIYRLEVSGFERAGTYSLDVSVLADDLPDERAIDNVTVPLSTSFFGFTETAQDVDVVAVDFVRGFYRLNAHFADESPNDQVQLNGSAGQHLLSQKTDFRDYIFEATVTGTYFFVFQSVEPNTFLVNVEPILDDHANSLARATPIEIDQRATGLLYHRDQDVFSFDVEKGAGYSIEVVADGNIFEEHLKDSQTTLAVSWTSGPRIWTADYTGKSFIRVSDIIGEYSLLITEVVDDHNDSPDENTLVVSLNAPQSTQFETIGDVDVFSVPSQPDTVYTLTLDRPAARLRVTDNVGSPLAIQHNASVVRWRSTSDRPHFIELMSDRVDAVEFSVSKETDDYADTPQDGSPILSTESTTAGRIHFYDDVDVFAFPAEKDVEVTFDIPMDVGSWRLIIRDRAGQFVDALGPERRWLPRKSGTFYLELSNAVNISDYILTFFSNAIVEPPDDDHPNAPTGSAVLLRENTSQTGILEFPNDQDVFRINIPENEAVRLQLDGSLVSRSPRVTSGNATVLGQDDGSFLVFSQGLGETFVSISSNRDIGSPGFDYSLSFEFLEDDHVDVMDAEVAEPLTMDFEFNSGILGSRADVDTFKFDAIGGTRYQFGSSRGRLRIGLPDEFIEHQQTGGDRIWTAPADGIYFVSFLASDRLGPYFVKGRPIRNDDHVDELNADATKLAFGIPVAGLIELGGDVDVFSIDLERGATTSFTLRGRGDIALFRGRTELVRSSGTWATLNWDAQASGRHYVTVTRAGDSFYDVIATLHRDDYPDLSNAASTVLEINTPVQGLMETESDVDVFRFEPETEVLEVKIEGQAASSARIDFLTASGRDLATDFETGDRWDVLPGATFVRIRDAGAYTLTLLAQTDDYADEPSPDAVAIALGTPLVAELDSPGDVDVFSFEAKAGEGFVFTASREGREPSPIDLKFYADGKVIRKGNNDLDWKAPERGVFHVSVSAVGEPGSYTAELSKTLRDDHPDSPNSASDAVRLLHGTRLSSLFEVASDLDFYRIDLEPNAVVTLSARQNTTNPVMRIMTATGHILASSSSTLTWKSNGGGSYLVAASTRQRGHYVISASIVQDDFPDRVNSSSDVIQYGERIEGSFEIAGDVDLIPFEAALGDRIGVVADRSDVRLLDANGTEVDSADRYIGRKIEVPGRYFIEVKGGRIGTYQVRLFEVARDDFPDEISEVNDVPVLKPDAEASVEFEVVGDVDIIPLEVQRGQAIRIEVGRRWDMLNFSIEDLNQQGVLTGTHLVEWIPETSGTFYLRLEAEVRDLHFIELQSIADDHPHYPNQDETLVSDIVAGNIDLVGDRDLLAINLNADSIVSFESAIGFLEPSIRLLTEDAIELDLVDGTDAKWIVPEDGRYLVEVQGEREGSYRFEVKRESTTD